MPKTPRTQEAIRKAAIGLIDNRQTDNDGMLIKRDRNVTMLDIFGTDQKTALAHYMSDLMAMGYSNSEMIDAINVKFGVLLKVGEVNKMKLLLYKLWRCDTAHAMNDQIAKQLAEIRFQKRELWKAWEESKKLTSSKKHTGHQESEAPEMSWVIDEEFIEEHKNAGDVKYLQLIADLGKEERKLLGLYAPEKKTVGLNGGTNNGTINLVVVGSDGNALNTQSFAPQVEQPANVEEAEAVAVESEEDEIDKLYKEIIG